MKDKHDKVTRDMFEVAPKCANSDSQATRFEPCGFRDGDKCLYDGKCGHKVEDLHNHT